MSKQEKINEYLILLESHGCNVGMNEWKFINNMSINDIKDAIQFISEKNSEEVQQLMK